MLDTATMTGTCLVCPNAPTITAEALLAHLHMRHGLPTGRPRLNRQEAVVFNTLTQRLPAGAWLPLGERAALARAIVETLALDEHLTADAGDPLALVPTFGTAPAT